MNARNNPTPPEQTIDVAAPQDLGVVDPFTTSGLQAEESPTASSQTSLTTSAAELTQNHTELTYPKESPANPRRNHPKSDRRERPKLEKAQHFYRTRDVPGSPAPEQSVELTLTAPSEASSEEKFIENPIFLGTLISTKQPGTAELSFDRWFEQLPGDKREEWKLRVTEPVQSEDMETLNANAFAAFGMDAQAAMEFLRNSTLYDDAATKDPAFLQQLKPLMLESFLKALITDPAARETIRASKLTPTEAVALRFYGREGFPYVQQSLRRKEDPTVGAPLAPVKTFKSLVKACQTAFEKLPPVAPGTHLFRGTNFFDGRLKPGTTYEDPAFFSTSTDPSVASGKFEGKFILKVVVPEKAPCRDISTLTGNPKEAEVLFLPNTKYYVYSHEETVPGPRWTVTLMPLT